MPFRALFSQMHLNFFPGKVNFIYIRKIICFCFKETVKSTLNWSNPFTWLRMTQKISTIISYFPRLPRRSSLTNINSLVTVGPRPSVSAAAAVIPAEVPVALTGAVEETDGPSFPIVPSIVRVLRAVRARVNRHGHALSAPRAGATRVVVESRGRRAALSTPESLSGHALSGELSAHDHRAHKHQNAAPKHHPKRWRTLRAAAADLKSLLLTEYCICTSTKTLSEINIDHTSTHH